MSICGFTVMRFYGYSFYIGYKGYSGYCHLKPKTHNQ